LTAAPIAAELQPWVFVGDEGRPEHELAARVRPVPWSIATNILSAAVAVAAIRALLPDGGPLRTSAPGPLGLPGGYPVRISPESIDLDLPHHVSIDAAIAHNQRVGQLDGIACIQDGVAAWTEPAATALRSLGVDLAQPLSSSEALPRARRLADALGLRP
jgi:hypothetical protein